MSEVSMYKNRFDTKGEKQLTVSEIYNKIGSGEWEKYTIPLRSMEYKSDEYKALKNSFPAFTLSGAFPEYQRNDESVVSVTDKIAIDLDNLKDSVYDVKESLKEDDFVESVFISAGGTGLVAVIKIDAKQFLEYFEAIEKYFKEKYNLVVDTSCKNISRLRYVTSDPDIYVNWDSKPFKLKPKAELFLPENYVGQPQIDPNSAWTEEDEVEKRCVNLIANSMDGQIHASVMKAAFNAGGYIAGMAMNEMRLENAMYSAVMQRSKSPQSEAWERKQIKDGIAKGKLKPVYELLVSEKNKNNSKEKSSKDFQFNFIKWYKLTLEEKSDAWQVIGSIRTRHREGDRLSNEDLLNICYANNFDVNTASLIYDEIKEKEKEFFGIAHKSKINQAKIYISHKFDIKFNIVKDMIEFKQDGKFVSNKAINNIWLYLQEIGLKLSEKDIRLLLGSNWVQDYDPIKNYFDSLEPWDNVDYIDRLSDYVNIREDNKDFFKSMFKKHLVRSVKCGLGKGENRFIFVFVDTKQNIGKTTFIRYISPFKSDYFTESFIKTGNQAKDTNISLTQNFIYNVDELNNVMGRNLEKFKSMLSSHIINERGSHRADSKVMVRRANFWGSTNNPSFLDDEVNTRWLCFEVDSFNFDYKKDIDINKVWGQAKALYDSGFVTDLTEDELKLQSDKNRRFDNYSTQDQIIMNNYEKCSKPMMLIDLMRSVSLKMGYLDKSPITPRSLGISLSKLGFKNKRIKDDLGNFTRKYYIREKLSESNDIDSYTEDAESKDDQTPIKKMF